MAKSYRSMRINLAFFCVLISALFTGNILSGSEVRNEPGSLDPLGKEASQRLGWDVLKKYRQLGVVKDFRFDFKLRIAPRREKSRYVYGVMIGSDKGDGLNARVDFRLKNTESEEELKTLRLLMKNGVSPYVWRSGGDGSEQTELMPSADYLKNIAGSEVSTFEILMPFRYWQHFYYEGIGKVGSRDMHVFWMYPPKEDEALSAQLSGVRLYIDEKFHAMQKAEIFSFDKVHLKTLTLGNLSKVDGVYIAKELDIRNEQTRDKTLIKIVDASIGVGISAYYLSPEALFETIIGKSLDAEILPDPVPFE